MMEGLEHLPRSTVPTYITGFNKTKVKKYMGIHDISDRAAEIKCKTTVKMGDSV